MVLCHPDQLHLADGSVVDHLRHPVIGAVVPQDVGDEDLYRGFFRKLVKFPRRFRIRLRHGLFTEDVLSRRNAVLDDLQMGGGIGGDDDNIHVRPL